MRRESTIKNRLRQVATAILLLLFCSCQSLADDAKEINEGRITKEDFRVKKVARLDEKYLEMLWPRNHKGSVGGYMALAIYDPSNIVLARLGQSSFLHLSNAGRSLQKCDLDTSFQLDRMKFVEKETIIMHDVKELEIIKWSADSIKSYQFQWPEDWWSLQGKKLEEFVTDYPLMKEYYDSRMSDYPLSRFHYSLELFSPKEDSTVYLMGFQMILRYRLGLHCPRIDRIFSHCDYTSIASEILYVDSLDRFEILYRKEGNRLEIRSLPNGNLLREIRADFPLGRFHSGFAIDARNDAIWFISDLSLEDGERAASDLDLGGQKSEISLFRMAIPN